jgi:hypothetical protein
MLVEGNGKRTAHEPTAKDEKVRLSHMRRVTQRLP